MDSDSYSPRQVASICKVTLREINRWMRQGKLLCRYSGDEEPYVPREELRVFMIEEGMDLTRLPRAYVVPEEQPPAAVIPPEVDALERRVKMLERYVKDLREKLFYRDGYRLADRLRISDAERTRIEAENQAAKRRWDAATDKQLAALR